MTPPPQKAKESLESYTKNLKERFPLIKDFDGELEKFQLWWAESGRKLKRPKLALLNWMTRAQTQIKQTNNLKSPSVKSLPTSVELEAKWKGAHNENSSRL